MKELYTSSALNDLHDSPGMKRDLLVKKYHRARQMAVLQGLWLRKRQQRLSEKGGPDQQIAKHRFGKDC